MQSKPVSEVAAHQYITQLEELYSLSEALTKSSSTVEEVYQTILGALQRLLKCDKASIEILDDGKFKVKSRIGVGRYKSHRFFPLTSKGSLIGRFAVYFKKPHKFSKEEIELARIIGKHISYVVNRRRTSEIFLDGIADGITVQNASGKLIFANKAAVVASGYISREEMLKNPARWTKRFQIKDDKNEPIAFSDLPGRRALKGEEAPEELIQFKNLKTGEVRWSVVKARAINGEDGTVDVAINIIHDITERMDLEKRKDEFISSASHELKTPVAVLKGFVQVMQLFASDDRNKYYLDKMNNQINRLTTLIEDLLDVSKIQSGKLELQKEKFNIVDLVRETTEDIQIINNNHKIIVKNGIPKKNIFADKYRIGEVLNNLISNAVKFSPHSDKVVVSLKGDTKNIVVRVEDFGIGISKKNLKRVFEPFFQADSKIRPSFGGLGLGLYISSQIIWRHGGKIWVNSKKGEGSTFAFSLPLKESS